MSFESARIHSRGSSGRSCTFSALFSQHACCIAALQCVCRTSTRRSRRLAPTAVRRAAGAPDESTTRWERSPAPASQVPALKSSREIESSTLQAGRMLSRLARAASRSALLVRASAPSAHAAPPAALFSSRKGRASDARARVGAASNAAEHDGDGAQDDDNDDDDGDVGAVVPGSAFGLDASGKSPLSGLTFAERGGGKLFAIFEAQGRQFKVQPDDVVVTERIKGVEVRVPRALACIMFLSLLLLGFFLTSGIGAVFLSSDWRRCVVRPRPAARQRKRDADRHACCAGHAHCGPSSRTNDERQSPRVQDETTSPLPAIEESPPAHYRCSH